MWMLEYINAILMYPGLFETENDALTWVEMQNVENPQDYVPVFVPVNNGNVILADVLPPRKSGRERLDRIYRSKRDEGGMYANQR